MRKYVNYFINTIVDSYWNVKESNVEMYSILNL